jgi:hypothetical protein
VPGAMASDVEFRLLGQTKHFVVFVPAEIPRFGSKATD